MITPIVRVIHSGIGITDNVHNEGSTFICITAAEQLYIIAKEQLLTWKNDGGLIKVKLYQS